MKKGVGEELLLESIIFVLTVVFIVSFWNKNWLIALTLLALYIIGNMFWHKKYDYVYYIAGFVIGPTAEIIAASFGVWTYANPSILNIPIWLPFAWGLAAIMILRIAQTVITVVENR
ncbi:MAG: hypothetical protein ABIG93_02335 [archaeon]|nr:hypothetical protein [Nanoarchaeota archaeon]